MSYSGSARRTAVHDGIDLRLGPIGKKHRLGIGVLLGDVAGAIVFLVAPREFVFLDAILLVLADRTERDQPRLYVLSHALLVDVERILGLARQNALGDELLQIRGTHGVDAVLVLINPFRQIDFRPADVQKRVRIALGQLARLRRIDDVIGNRGHAGRQLGLGPVRSKGLNQRHEHLSTTKIRPCLAARNRLPDCTFRFFRLAKPGRASGRAKPNPTPKYSCCLPNLYSKWEINRLCRGGPKV